MFTFLLSCEMGCANSDRSRAPSASSSLPKTASLPSNPSLTCPITNLLPASPPASSSARRPTRCIRARHSSSLTRKCRVYSSNILTSEVSTRASRCLCRSILMSRSRGSTWGGWRGLGGLWSRPVVGWRERVGWYGRGEHGGACACAWRAPEAAAVTCEVEGVEDVWDTWASEEDGAEHCGNG